MRNKVVQTEEVIKNPKYGKIKLADGKYTGSYIISNNDRFQSIYSSQNYGCFYEMYIKANFDDQESGLIKSFEFRIVNYKGPLNVGFANIDEQKDELYFNNEGGVGVIGLKILITGRNNTNEMIFEVPKSWGITKDNAKQLNIYRMLLPLDGLEIDIEKQVEVFDTEFFQRNGLEISRRKIVPKGHYDFDEPMKFGPDIKDISQPNFIDKELISIQERTGQNGILSKDGNCHTSKMFIKK